MIPFSQNPSTFSRPLLTSVLNFLISRLNQKDRQMSFVSFEPNDYPNLIVNMEILYHTAEKE